MNVTLLKVAKATSGYFGQPIYGTVNPSRYIDLSQVQEYVGLDEQH
jgi:hypothetical protein